jgi:hypothetical protein
VVSPQVKDFKGKSAANTLLSAQVVNSTTTSTPTISDSPKIEAITTAAPMQPKYQIIWLNGLPYAALLPHACQHPQTATPQPAQQHEQQAPAQQNEQPAPPAQEERAPPPPVAMGPGNPGAQFADDEFAQDRVSPFSLFCKLAFMLYILSQNTPSFFSYLFDFINCKGRG